MQPKRLFTDKPPPAIRQLEVGVQLDPHVLETPIPSLGVGTDLHCYGTEHHCLLHLCYRCGEARLLSRRLAKSQRPAVEEPQDGAKKEDEEPYAA